MVAGRRPRFSLLWALAICFGLAFQAHATTIYSSLQFTLYNPTGCGVMDNCGSATVTSGNLVFSGEQTGSGEYGETDLLATAPGTGTVSFSWSFGTLNSPGEQIAGDLVAPAMFTQLADTNLESGSASFAVTAGQSFGFVIRTSDNEGEPGTLTISNFSAPGSSAPEPGTLPLAIVGVAGIVVYKFKMRSRQTTR
jgi:hypothetical protein